MLNLIVKGANWVGGRFEFLLGRILEYTADEVAARFQTQQGPDFNALRQFANVVYGRGA